MALLEHIKQLDALLRRYSSQRRQIINLKSPKKSGKKSGRLLLTLRDRPELSAKEVGEILGEQEGSQAYHAFKSNVFYRLLNGVLLLDLRSHGFSDYGVAFYKNCRTVSIARILAALGGRALADSVAARGLRVAEKYELASNAIEFIGILQQGALLNGDRVALKKLRASGRRWIAILSAEMEMTGVWQDVLVLHARRGSADPRVRARLADALFEANSMNKRIYSFNLRIIQYRLDALYRQCLEQYSECIKVCTDAEGDISLQPHFNNPTRLAEFAIKRLACAVHLGDLKEGTDAIKVCELAYPAGSLNWFVQMENCFLLHTISLKLDKARLLYNQVTKTSGYLDLPDFRRERWTIYNLYLLYGEGKLTQNSRLSARSAKSFKEVLSWVPSYSKDKVGYNACLLILHILYLIERKDWLKIVDRIEALKDYRERHLVGRNRRADLFIQLLLHAERASFSREKVEAESSATFQALVEASDTNDAIAGIQILPFPWLWQRVLVSLKP